MLQNCLASYVDKPTKGNTIFTKAQQQVAAQATAQQKATAVTAEFDIQNETSQALIERASNIWEKSFVNSDNAAGGIHDIAAAWYDMTKAITESLSFMGEAGLLLKSLTLSHKSE